MNPDREYLANDGSKLTLNGRSLMFVRNVGHLMTNPAILDADGNEVPEGIMDGVITSLISLHDLKRTGDLSNSAAGSSYIVKPKMHGPEEVAFTNDLFDAIEDALGLERTQLKWALWTRSAAPRSILKSASAPPKAEWCLLIPGFWIAPAMKSIPACMRVPLH